MKPFQSLIHFADVILTIYKCLYAKNPQKMQLYHIAGTTVERSGDQVFYGPERYVRKIGRTVIVQSLTNP